MLQCLFIHSFIALTLGGPRRLRRSRAGPERSYGDCGPVEPRRLACCCPRGLGTPCDSRWFDRSTVGAARTPTRAALEPAHSRPQKTCWEASGAVLRVVCDDHTLGRAPETLPARRRCEAACPQLPSTCARAQEPPSEALRPSRRRGAPVLAGADDMGDRGPCGRLDGPHRGRGHHAARARRGALPHPLPSDCSTDGRAQYRTETPSW